MGLTFTSDESQNLTGYILRAKDDETGSVVIVHVSIEVTQDHSLDEAKIVADRKYEIGQIEENGTVSIKTTDMNDG